MKEKNAAQAGQVRAITLRRDGQGALKFNGERLNSATRNKKIEGDDGTECSFEICARYFKTTGSKYVVGVEVYNQTDEQYEYRNGFVDDSLESLGTKCSADNWLDADILGELFEDSEIGDKFVEHID